MSKLLPVQEAALAKARHKPGFAYFMDMGLGKSLTALTEFLSLADEKAATRLVIICPNSFKQGWAAEISKHRLNLAVHVYSATRHKWAEDFISTRFKLPPVLILNYEAIRLTKVRELLADFTTNRKVMLVLDESIAIKNPSSKRTKAIHKLRENFSVVRLLTGKPVTQGAHDLWSQLFMIKGLHFKMNFYSFRNRFCQMGGFEGRQVIGVKHEQELRSIIKAVSFEAKKKDWLPGLPAKSYTTRTYELSDVLQDHYDEMEREFVTWLADNQDVTAEIALTKYGKLQQVMCGFIHDNDGRPEWLTDDEYNPRLQLLKETLDEIEGKVCVVYRHKFVGEQLQQTLLAYKPALIAGHMKPEDIETEKFYFNTDPTCRVILLQVDASKYGHTLVGTREDPCYTMVFYENTFSLDTRSQIEDRIHRIGQVNACLYLDFVGCDMDRRVVKALQGKERVYQALFGERPLAAE